MTLSEFLSHFHLLSQVALVLLTAKTTLLFVALCCQIICDDYSKHVNSLILFHINFALISCECPPAIKVSNLMMAVHFLSSYRPHDILETYIGCEYKSSLICLTHDLA